MHISRLFNSQTNSKMLHRLALGAKGSAKRKVSGGNLDLEIQK